MYITNKFRELYSHWKRKKEIKNYFSKPFEERAKITKESYTFEKTKDRFRAFFRSKIRIEDNVQFFFDACVGFGLGCKPNTIRQIGCWTGTESKFLVNANFVGNLQATDFDTDRIDFLIKEYTNTKYKCIDFFYQDIEQIAEGDFADVNCVVAQAVLSNIQPEFLNDLFGAFRKDGVDLVLIGDCYTKDSLTMDPNRTISYQSAIDRNWFHPFLAYGVKFGFDVRFIPDFSYSSFHIARGVFVLYRNIDNARLSESMKIAYDSYFSRQEGVWKNYQEVDMNKPYDISEIDIDE